MNNVDYSNSVQATIFYLFRIDNKAYVCGGLGNLLIWIFCTGDIQFLHRMCSGCTKQIRNICDGKFDTFIGYLVTDHLPDFQWIWLQQTCPCNNFKEKKGVSLLQLRALDGTSPHQTRISFARKEQATPRNKEGSYRSACAQIFRGAHSSLYAWRDSVYI